jgi:hypothetical protein
MHKRTLTELILARCAGRDRGAAIYGDLVEMSAARGSAWFWMAYARTLIALTWRTAAGFVAGYLSYDVLLSCFRLWDQLTNEQHAAASFGLMVIVMKPALTTLILTGLIFAFYAGVRYGLRDRMALLACAIFLLHLIGFALDSFLVASLAPAAALVCALCVRAWRKPALVYAVTVFIAAAMFIGSMAPLALASAFIEEHLPHAHLVYRAPMPWNAMIVIDLIVAMAVCSAMRRWLLERHRNRSVWL